jgi:streptogramin lyase
VAGAAGATNGAASIARLNAPISVAASRDGSTIYLTDASHTVRRLAADGSVTLIAGGTNTAAFADGAATEARFNTPSGLALETSGALWVSDTLNQVMRRISCRPRVHCRRLARHERVRDRGWQGHRRSIPQPLGISLAPDGALWVADASNHRIRRMTSDATVTTLAGTSNWGSNDGNGSNAWFDTPNAVVVDSLGEGHVADTNNNLVRVVTVNGDVTAIAGSDVAAASTDGAGRNARFNAPRGIAIDASGVIYIADSGNHTIRRFGPAGGVAFTQTPRLSPPRQLPAPSHPAGLPR